MLAIERVTKKKPKELLDLVELPDTFRECWFWFISLNNTRSSGFGMSPITYTEILSYFMLMEIDVEPWEVDVIKMFDGIALESTKKQQEKEQLANKNKKK